jgi:predicted lipoprotein with Yx(FWY)xxD motif
MKRVIVPGMAVAAVLAISACGGGGSGGGSTSGAAAAGGANAISVQQISGAGRVLVDQSGKPVYTSDVEANGQIVCSGGCTSFWKPVTGVAGKTAAAGTGKLGELKRPDGTMQLTANGRPLYTFSEDSPGKATGDGFTDDFSGHHFTWHLVRSGGKTSSGDKPSTSGQKSNGGGNGAPYDSSGSGGGYGY